MSFVITFANQKGGVAKTTSVASLGGALTQLGNQVLMIDLDAQADLTLAMGIDPKQVRGSVADIFLNSNSLTSLCRETPIAGLDLVPSNQEMALAEHFLTVRNNYEQILGNALRTHLPTNAYDYILIDCPPALGAATYNALHAAQLLIIPTQPEYFSTHALKNMMTAIRRARSQGNPNLQYRFLITMLDCRIRVHRSLSEELRTTLGKSLFQTVIEIDTKLRECSIAGLPITHFISKTRSSVQYQALAQELLEYVREKDALPTA